MQMRCFMTVYPGFRTQIFVVTGTSHAQPPYDLGAAPAPFAPSFCRNFAWL
jgi:hypothetical protein